MKRQEEKTVLERLYDGFDGTDTFFVKTSEPGNVEGSTVEYWVDSVLGSDSNPGTQAAPFATIAKAREKIPTVLKANYRVWLVSNGSANPYSANDLAGWRVVCAPGSLCVQGTADYFVHSTNTAVSGTANSITFSGTPFSADGLIGYFAEITRLDGRVIYRTITTCTTDTLYLAHADISEDQNSATPYSVNDFEAGDVVRVIYPNCYLTAVGHVRIPGDASPTFGENTSTIIANSSPTFYLVNVSLLRTGSNTALVALESGCMFGVGAEAFCTFYAPKAGVEQTIISPGPATAGWVSDPSVWHGYGVYYPSAWRTPNGGTSQICGCVRNVIASGEETMYFTGRTFGGSGTTTGLLQVSRGARLYLGYGNVSLSSTHTSITAAAGQSNTSIQVYSGGKLFVSDVNDITFTTANRDAILADGPGSYVYITATGVADSISATRYGLRARNGGKIEVNGDLTGKVIGTTADLAAGDTPVTGTAAGLVVGTPVVGGPIADGSLIIRSS